MEKITPRTLSGFKDRLPNEAIKKRDILNRLGIVFERFGFSPIETPHLEYADVLLKRGSDEIQKELYRFSDHGGRDVALRFDLTVPLARFAVQHRHALKIPFKRYAIGNVFRGERAQAGRYREFTQCDFDFLGSDSIVSDAEVTAVLEAGFLALGIEQFKIFVNSRKLMNGFSKSLGIEDKIEDILRIVDKLDKIGEVKVVEELKSCGISTPEEIIAFVSTKESGEGFWQKVEGYKNDAHLKEGIEELLAFYETLEAMGVDRSRFEIDFSIARGLGYYTGIVYESRLLECMEIGSVASGGRYDNLTQTFSDEPLSGVGASFGVDRLIAALEKMGKLEEKQTPAIALAIAMDAVSMHYLLGQVSVIRQSGLNVETYPDIVKMKKSLDFANKKGYGHAIIVGGSEVEAGTLVLKNLKEGSQQTLKTEEIIKILKG